MLGTTLRQARESREESLREVEWATKIKADYLTALEAEDYAHLPAAVYTRGFIRTYSRHLGIDPEPLIADYNREPLATQIVSTLPAVRPRRKAFAVTPTLLAAGTMLILVGVFGTYVVHQVLKYQATRAQGAPIAQPSNNLAPLPTPSATPSVTAAASPGAPRVYSGVEVAIRLDAPTWLRVDVDGKPSDQTGGAGGKTFPTGATITVTGQSTVHVRSGKAVHTFVTVNGRDLGPMPAAETGGIGDRTYTGDSVK